MHCTLFLVTSKSYDAITQNIDGRINFDNSFDVNEPVENSGSTTAVTGGIGGAVCLVALIAAMAVKRKRKVVDETNKDQGKRSYLKHPLQYISAVG